MNTILFRLVWALLWLFGRLPLVPMRYAGTLLGHALWRLNSKACRIARINIAHCFSEQSQQQQQTLLQQFLLEYSRELMLAPAILTRSVSSLRPLVTQVQGGEELREAIKQGPVLLLNVHIDSLLLSYCFPEFFATWLSQVQKGIFEPVLDKRRKSFKLPYVHTDAMGVRRAYKELKAGNTVGMFCDQDPGRQGRVLAKFFGQPAYTATLPAKLISATGAQAFFYFCCREDHGTHYSLRIIPVDTDVYNQNITTSTQALNDQLEGIIRQLPAHFDWSYERFRRANRDLYKPVKRRQ